MLRVVLAMVACVAGPPSSAAAPSAYRVIATIPVGSSPAVLAFDRRTGSMYVADIFSDDVSVLAGCVHVVVGR
jgi:DNA-binding beta-propeller fold protein YncE